jgi:hypothetical protein
LTLTAAQVYQTYPMSRFFSMVLVALMADPASVWAGDLPITKNLPIPEFQNKPQDATPYDFDAPPQGMFRAITMAEGFEEEMGFRQTHEIVPVNPTERFSADTPAIFIVFTLHQHYQAFKVFGRCFPEGIPGIEPGTMVSEDAMHMALEDESGYLRLLPQKERWVPGRYKVEIHAGEQVSDMSLIGTMRFTVVAGK